MVIEGLMCDHRSCRELIIDGGGEEVDGGDIAKVGQRMAVLSMITLWK